MMVCVRKSACRARPCRLEEAEDQGRADRQDRDAADGRASSERAEFRCAVGIFLAGQGAGLSADRGADLRDELIDRQQRGESLGARQDGRLQGAGQLAEAEAACRAWVHRKAESRPDAREHPTQNRAALQQGETLYWLEALEPARAVVVAEVRWKLDLGRARALQTGALAELQASERQKAEAAPPERAAVLFPEPPDERWPEDELGLREWPAQALASQERVLLERRTLRQGACEQPWLLPRGPILQRSPRLRQPLRRPPQP